MTTEIRQAVLKAVNELKDGQFKATAIKVELEAQLNRQNDDENTCPECCGDFWNECERCEGSGCDDCDHDGGFNCDECDEGFTNTVSGEYSDEDDCYDFLMDKLKRHGLAKKVDGEWQWKHPLRFAKFYNDGSVDSEFTFTIMLDKPENVFLLEKVITAFNDFIEVNGGYCDTNGAGMHTSILYDKDGTYYSEYTWRDNDEQCFRNFSKSMTLLMPALYCLAADNGRARGTGYRIPGVGNDTHRAAIDFRGNALEFRIFDTCYDHPEQIYDNIVVISKCMRYWSQKYNNPGMDKITKEIRFGRDDGNSLDRFYTTVKHIDLLNAGLKKLKPDYYTIGEIKKARGLTITRSHINKKVNDFRKNLEVEYKEYCSRYDWSLLVQRHERLAQLLKRMQPGDDQGIAEEEVEAFIKQKQQELKKLEDYMAERLAEFERDNNRGTRLSVA